MRVSLHSRDAEGLRQMEPTEPSSALLKAISWFRGATIDPPSIDIVAGIATGPTQEKRGSERKNDGLTVEARLNAYTLCGGGQGEGESVPEDGRIGPVFHLTDHRTKDLGL